MRSTTYTCASHVDLFEGLPDEIEVWMSHGDQVSAMSAGFVPLAETKTCPIAAVKHATLPIYGLQFHPEVTHTPLGARVLGNFLTRICGCTGTWQLGDFAEQAIEQIRLPAWPGTADLRPFRRASIPGRGGPHLSGDRFAVCRDP